MFGLKFSTSVKDVYVSLFEGKLLLSFFTLISSIFGTYVIDDGRFAVVTVIKDFLVFIMDETTGDGTSSLLLLPFLLISLFVMPLVSLTLSILVLAGSTLLVVKDIFLTSNFSIKFKC